VRLSQLSLKGVCGLLPSLKLNLAPGLNVFVAAPTAQAAFVRGIEQLFFASDYDPDAESLRAAGTATTEGALLLAADSGVVLRLARDLISGRARLWRHDPTTQEFVAVSQDAREAGAQLKSQAGVCDAKTFRAVFVLDPTTPPPDAASSDDGAALPPAPTYAGHVQSPAEMTARLTEIEGLLVNATAAEQLEFSLDGLQKQRFALDQQLLHLNDPDAALAAAQAAMAHVANVPSDLAERYARSGKLRSRRDADCKRIDDERAAATARRPRAPAPLASSPWLWAGLALGAAAIAAAAGLAARWRSVALLDIPAFGAATAVTWLHLHAREKQASLRRLLALLDDRRAKILARDADELDKMDKLALELRIVAERDVVELTGMRAAAEERLAAVLAATVSHVVAEDGQQGLHAERRALDARIDKLEADLATLNALGNATALRQEAALLRARLTSASAPSAALAFAAPRDADMGAGGAGADPRAWLAALLVATGNAWLSVGRDALLTALSTEASRISTGWTAGRLGGLDLGSGASLVVVRDGEPTAWAALSPGDRQILYTALRCSVVTACPAALRMPTLVVNGGGKLAHASANVLAESAQVLYVTAQAEGMAPEQYVTLDGGAAA